jgi:ribosomal protein S18 acetylase RimI-like enzyme
MRHSRAPGILLRVSSSVRIRRAHTSDAAAIAGVHTTSWRETYVRALPDDFLAGFEVPTEVWSQRIRDASPSAARVAIWVAEQEEDDQDRVVGFAAVGPDPEEEGTGRLYSIYVLQAAQGTGVGRRLHQVALRSLAELGFAEATLWVAVKNDAARRFYELADWKPDRAQRTEQVGDIALPVVRYRISLAQSSDTDR